MSQIPAVPINSIEGYQVTEDGNHMLLKTDFPPTLAIHESALLPLLTSVIACIGQTTAKKGEERPVFSAQWWEFGVSPDGQSLILSFRLQGGANFSFKVHRDQCAHMSEVLSVIAQGESNQSRTGGPIQ